MADSHVWEGEDVALKVQARGKKYQSTQKVEFVFTTDDGKSIEVGRAPVAVDRNFLSANVAKGTWKKVKKASDVKAAGSTFSDLWYRAQYHLEVDGETVRNFADKIWVYAKQITVTALDAKEPSKKFKGAMCRLTQEAAVSGTGGDSFTYSTVRQTDDKGEIKFNLKYASSKVKLEWQKPYVGDWTPGKDVGAVREAKITFAVKLAFPSKQERIGMAEVGATDDDHVQWVNLERDPKHPEYGHAITIKVKVAAEAAEGENLYVGAGRKVYLKAKFDAANSDRFGATQPVALPVASGPRNRALKGQEYKAETTMGADGVALFEIDLGHAGGDKVVVKVGSTEACKDDEVTIVSWRKVFYKILAPEPMVTSGKVIAATLEDGTEGHDLQKDITDWAEARLDKGFIKYLCAGATLLEEDALAEARMIDGGHLGLTKGTDYYVLGGDFAKQVFEGTEKHTIYVQLCDRAVSPKAPAPYASAPLTAVTSNIAATGYVLPVRLDVGGPTLTNLKWTAVVTGTAPDHPGRNPDGTAKSGAIPMAWLDLADAAFRIKLVLQGVPAGLVGAKSATKCPIKVTWNWALAGGINGNSGGGKQVMVMGRPPKAIACTVCHELGHSMGQTVYPTGPKKKQVPHGMEYPKTVLEPGGDTYENTYGHNGSHCANGVADRPTAGAAFSFAGKGGTCIMFGEGGDDEEPTRANFCAGCLKYIKARKLDDIRSYWDARIDYEC